MRYYFSILTAFAVTVLLESPAAMAVPGTWAGYAIMDGSVAANGTVVSAMCDNNSTRKANTTVWPGHGEYSESVPQGYYTLSFECITNVNFYICGIAVPLVAQTFTPGPHYNGTATPNFNISVSKLANSASCTYSCACSGSGHCCSGATEYTVGEGTGACQASACAAAVTTTTLGGGGGGGGGGVATTTTTLANVTTTTTTIPLPPKEETETIANIPANGTGGFEFTETAITDIDVTTKSNVSNPAITVAQSSSKPATVVISASNAVYGYLTITKTNIIDADVSNVKIRFKVAKSWISGNRIDESAVTLSRYSLGAWTALQTTKTGDDGTYVYFEAVSPGLSVFAISAVQRTLPTFWNIVTYIDNYYKGQITFWSLIGHISDYYTG